MHGGGGSLSPSEKLNHLSECGQSALERDVERDEIALLPPALNPLSIVVCSQTSSKLGSAASIRLPRENLRAPATVRCIHP